MITKTKYNPFFKDVKESAVKKAKELEAYGVKTDIISYPENGDEEKVLPVATKSFGGIGVFAIKEMGRFYRHVLIENPFK